MTKMKLLIDTTQAEKIIVALIDKSGREVARREKKVFQISENLLPEIERLLKLHNLLRNSLRKILVNPGPGGFSSTRTGVAMANALAYALNIPVAEWPSGKIKALVLPRYSHEPRITLPRQVSS